jgi:two-component system, cell cycle sensor histidine kinase and response regulator CckA
MPHSPVRRPLARRLPIVVAAVFGLVAAGISWAAYREVKRTILDATATHLRTASREIRDMLQAQVPRLPRELEPLAANDVVRALVRGQDARRDSVHALLAAGRARAPQLLAVSVWLANGRLATADGSPSFVNAMHEAVFRPARPATRVAGPFVAVGDSVVYGVAVPILGSAHDTLGFVVGTRTASGSNGVAQIQKLVGRNSRLMLGNVSGDVWTNLAGRVNAPPLNARDNPGMTFTGYDGRPHIGASTMLAGTPWVVWVESPIDATLAPAQRFLTEMIALAIVFAFAGGIVVWIILRRALAPLEEVRQAAEALILGRASRTVVVQTADEIGSLAQSFNTMAERVRASSQEIVSRAEALERSNEELRESERRYRQLVDQSPDAIIVHRDGRIIFANSVASQLVGSGNPGDLLESPILDLVHPTSREEAGRRIRRVQQTQMPSPLTELRLQRPDGTPIVVEVSGTAVTFDGMPAVQTLARDISERHLLEEQLRQSQKMEAVGRLAGGIAHDFNNLLTIINTYAELTLSAMDADHPSRADIEDIRHAGLSAAQLTRQMLAFSRKQVLAPRVLDLNDAIETMTGMLKRVIGDHVEVVTNLRPCLGAIWADAGQLEQVVVNLAVNARDAMPGGGLLRIETDAATLDFGYASHHGHAIPAGDYVVLAVSDTGTGMTEDVRQHIFEPFFTTKQTGQGTGLGLAMVYGIVKQSDGYIWVYSEPGRGTSFKLYFPRYLGDDANARDTTNEYPLPVSAHAEILLVEDDPRVRAAVRRVLDRSPYVVTEAGSAPEAIDIFAARGGRFNLVITDMMMPSMTGDALIHELRTRNADLRAIIMSGYSEEATAREWRLPPNAAFLEKPISPATLLRCVDEVLQGAPVLP